MPASNPVILPVAGSFSENSAPVSVPPRFSTPAFLIFDAQALPLTSEEDATGPALITASYSAADMPPDDEPDAPALDLPLELELEPEPGTGLSPAQAVRASSTATAAPRIGARRRCGLRVWTVIRASSNGGRWASGWVSASGSWTGSRVPGRCARR